MDGLREDMRELAAQIVALAPQLGKLTDAEAQPLVAALAAMANAEEAVAYHQQEAAALALLCDGPFAVALSQCIAYGARLSHSGLFSAASKLTMQLLDALPPQPPAAGPLAFLRALLRMQTLHCMARLLADATQYVTEEAAAAAEAAGDAAVEAAEGGAEGVAVAAARPAGSLTNLAHIINDTTGHVSVLCRIATRAAEQPQAPVATAATPADKERRRLAVSQRVFVGELVSALADSGVMEHLARALLVGATAGIGAALAGEGAVQTRKWLTLLVASYINTFNFVNNLMVAVEAAPGCGGPAAASRLRSQLQGPCAQHLALTSGLAALCLADGGPAHGLPQALLQALPVLAVGADGGAVDARSLHGRQCVTASHVFNMADCLPCKTRPHLPPTLRPAAAASLLLRVGRWAVASARAWAEPQPLPQLALVQGAGDPEPQPLRLLIRRGELSAHLHLALRQLDQLLAVTDLALDREAAWRVSVQRWRLLVEAVEDPGAYNDDDRALALSKLCGPFMKGEVVGPGGMLPPEPPAPLPAALAAGLLPCLERLLRRAGEQPSGREAQRLALLLETNSLASVLLMRLLAYGEPAQAAALVTTLAKLLRCAEAGRNSTALSALSAARRLYKAAPLYLTSQPSPARSRLLLLLSRSVVEWLPPLCRMAQRSASRPLQTVRDVEPTAFWLAELDGHFSSIHFWIPLLIEPTPGATSAPASSGSGDDGSGWRQFLVEEAGDLSVLGALLLASREWEPRDETAASVVSHASLWCKVVHSCAHVAVGAPEELRRAVQEGAGGGGGPSRVSGGSKPGGGAGPASGWRPQVLAKLAVKMRAARFKIGASLAQRLSKLFSVWAEGGDASAGLAELRAMLSQEEVQKQHLGPLPPLASVRALLPSCAHQRCTRLDGDSEAGRELRRYPGCGEGAYCSAACAQEHGAGAAAGGSGAA